MYPPEDSHPVIATIGDVLEHKLMPGFRMRALEARDCETDYSRPEPHQQFRVTDPEGNEDWVCGYDVRRIP